MTDRIPGVMTDTCVRLFGRGEAFDSDGFIGFFTDAPMYQFGNGQPCFTKAEIRESISGFFASVAALYHDIRNVWEDGDVVFVEMDVMYWRKDGSMVTLPCCDIFRFEGSKIQELRIFMDANPVFNPALPVGKRASVFTQGEGRRAASPDTMRKYFTEHPEGVQRTANGYPPKWGSAGPKWPMTPKMDLLNAFQGAIASGNWDAFKSSLTGGAVLKVANRAEVVGPQPILDALLALFGNELRATGANFTGIWEQDNALILEMVVQATRVSDGQPFEYPCVETYRFEGQKISEWRIYPITPVLLDHGQ
jgi:ketosteroid isomerase-like protein